jgi:hypothetical protein
MQHQQGMPEGFENFPGILLDGFGGMPWHQIYLLPVAKVKRPSFNYPIRSFPEK